VAGNLAKEPRTRKADDKVYAAPQFSLLLQHHGLALQEAAALMFFWKQMQDSSTHSFSEFKFHIVVVPSRVPPPKKHRKMQCSDLLQ